MTTVQAFNTMLRNFLEELRDVFPEQQDVATFLAGFDAFVMLNARKPLEVFMDAVSPHSDLLMARDPRLFDRLDFPGIDFAAMWNSPDVSEATHGAIWQYLHTLFLLGSTVSSLPPELLTSIESVASDCVEKIQSGQLDFGAMAGALMSGLGPLAGLAGGGGDNPLEALLGAAPDRSVSRGKKRK